MPRRRRSSNSSDLQQAGKLLRLEVELANARLYAVHGNFVPLVAGQAWRFRDEGVVPESRPGF